MNRFLLALSCLAFYALIGYAESPHPYIQLGNPNIVKAQAISSDGRILAVGTSNLSTNEGTVSLRHVATGLEFRVLLVPQGQLPPVSSLAFSLDSKRLAVGTWDGSVLVWDIEKDTLLWSSHSHGDPVTGVAFSPDGKSLASASIESLVIQNVANPDLERLHQGYAFASSLAWNPNGDRLAVGTAHKTIEIWDVQRKTTEIILKGESGQVLKLAFVPGKNRIVSVCDDGSSRVWDLDTQSIVATLAEKSADGKESLAGLAVSPDGTQCVVCYSKSEWRTKLFDLSTGTLINGATYGFGFNDAVFFPDGTKVALATGNPARASVVVWDLHSRRDLWAGKIAAGDSLAVNDKTGLLLSGSMLGNVAIWSRTSLRPVFLGSPHHNEVFLSSFSADGNTAWTLSGDLTCRRYDVTAPGVPSVAFPLPVNRGELASGIFDVPNQCLYLGLVDGTVIKCSLADGKVLQKARLSQNFISGFELAPNGTLIVTSGDGDEDRITFLDSQSLQAQGDISIPFVSPNSKDKPIVVIFSSCPLAGGAQVAFGTSSGEILIVDVANKKLLTRWQASPFGIDALAADGQNLYSGGEDRIVRLWNFETAKLLNQWNYHQGAVKGLALDAKNHQLISSSEDGAIRLLDLSSGHWLGMASSDDDSQWIIFTDDGYWDGSPGCQELIAMVKGTEVYSVDQFAIQGNRPDIILRRLGNGDTQLIDHYRNQYLKRLKKLGMVESAVDFAAESVPIATIVSTKQTGRILSMDLHFDGKTSEITSWNVWINGVPQFGSLGREASGKSLDTQDPVILNPGDNKIEASCVGRNGVEAYRAQTLARWDGTVEPRLYYLGFGVSRYANPELALNWAAKDAQDLAALFGGNQGKRYSRVVSKAWTDAQATPQALKEAESLLADARPEDTVILFIAGHGVHDIDPEATYYYLTHDADIHDLAHTAVPFESFENLLANSAPREKLFLMDTCESGSDTDEVSTSPEAGSVQSGGHSRQMVISGRPRMAASVQNAVTQKDRWIYNDIVRRSGAVVFSSSRGGESSYEYNDLQNGAFTSAIISCLTDKKWDTAGKGWLTSQDLRTVVPRLVTALVSAREGRDAQHPTVDRDNLDAVIELPVMNKEGAL